MSKRLDHWTGWRDLGFFVHWEGLAVAAGTIGLVVLEWWTIPRDWALASFVADYRIWVMLAFALLIGLPPTIARGFDHLRARSEAGKTQVEMAAALYGLEMRLMNFVSKLREVFAGHVTNTYQNHTLGDCRQYFKTRGGAECAVEVNFYRLKRSARSTRLERALWTGNSHPGMRSTFSNARSASTEAKKLIKSITSGNSVFCRDVRNAEDASALSIENGSDRPYRAFLTVPVFRDKSTVGDERVIGMLSVNADKVDLLSASDEAILKVYAWVLAAAFEADAQARRGARNGGPSASNIAEMTSGGDLA